MTVGGSEPVTASPPAEETEFDVVREALKDEYELIKELGRGGMATVYRAREKGLDREVAVKVLPFSLAFDKDFVERFQREARTAAKLEHPHIIPIYRVG
ncbi:MAG: protein kinase, partial [Gemmatimonadetes bacterium]|nr:protein kinase [Gemmatimonadota bacterium]